MTRTVNDTERDMGKAKFIDSDFISKKIQLF